jgi:hypothetical protein
MTLMIDEILAGRFKLPPTLAQLPAKDRDTMRESRRKQLAKAVPIVADNVAEYLYAVNDQEDWDMKHDFPNIAPPFPSFWIEHGRPSKLVSREYGTKSSATLPYRVGVWFAAVGRDELERRVKCNENRYEIFTQAQQAIQEFGRDLEKKLAPMAGKVSFDEMMKTLSPSEMGAATKIIPWLMLSKGVQPEIPDSVGWAMHAEAFIEGERGQIQGPFYSWDFLVGGQGQVVTHRGPALMMSSAEMARRFDGLPVGDANGIAFAPLLAISFLHCKNVRVTDQQPDRAASRDYQWRNRRPLVTYKTLEIDPMREVLRREGGSEHHGLQKALHICRGHFATYSPDRPLFGRVSGTFWKPMHVRGSEKAGVVVKDYDVKAPAVSQ